MSTKNYRRSVSYNTSNEEASNQKAHRMTFEMDKKMHSQLKIASAREGLYIKDILIEATHEWLKKKGY